MAIYVMTHKKVNMKLPQNYKLMLLGSYNKKVPKGYLSDNFGENISSKNANYCELTGLYELWKNYDDKNIGLVHYRRFFSKYNFYSRFLMYIPIVAFGKIKLHPISVNKLENFLKNYDWIVSVKEIQFGKNLWDHYSKNHYESDLISVRNIIKEYHPSYIRAFDHVMRDTNRMSPFNMFYTSKSQMDLYCKWLFDILFKLEEYIDTKNYDDFQKRVFGFISEELFNVWIFKNRAKIKVKYLSVYNTNLVTRNAVLKRVKDRGRVK